MQAGSTRLFILGGVALRCVAPSILLTLLLSAAAYADGGSEIFKAKCSACHGASGAGDSMLGKNLKIPSLISTEIQSQSDDELFATISKGKKKMPAFNSKLSPDQIRSLVKHIRSLKP